MVSGTFGSSDIEKNQQSESSQSSLQNDASVVEVKLSGEPKSKANTDKKSNKAKQSREDEKCIIL